MQVHCRDQQAKSAEPVMGLGPVQLCPLFDLSRHAHADARWPRGQKATKV
jgi:hypothetical protein